MKSSKSGVYYRLTCLNSDKPHLWGSTAMSDKIYTTVKPPSQQRYRIFSSFVKFSECSFLVLPPSTPALVIYFLSLQISLYSLKYYKKKILYDPTLCLASFMQYDFEIHPCCCLPKWSHRFPLIEQYSIVWTCQDLFIYSPADGHWAAYSFSLLQINVL